MKILQINNSDFSGGAAQACSRINKALRENGVNSALFVQRSSGQPGANVFSVSENVFEKYKTYSRIIYDMTLIKALSRESRGRFSFPFYGKDITGYKQVRNADILHLHWVNEGFFSFNTLRELKRLNKPIVWTLHDMWAFTGGCHYSLGCKNYEKQCRNCPSLKFSSEQDFSTYIFNKKLDIYNELDLTIVTCSNWLAGEARKSVLLKDKNILAIPNPIDTDVFYPMVKDEARHMLNLPKDKFLIVFGTMTLNDIRKGYSLFKEALYNLDEKFPELKERIKLLVFGKADIKEIADLPYELLSLGRLNDPQKISACYSSGNLFVAPSIEDNLPNTVMESLSCGTPVVAFNIGGIPDMVTDKKNGYLASPYSTGDLADGIKWFYDRPETLSEFSANARKKVMKSYTFNKVGKQYKALFDNILLEKSQNRR